MKTILITGASHGIGKAIAEKLAACGMRLFLNCRSSKETLYEYAVKLSETYHVPCTAFYDVSDHKQVHAMFEEICALGESIDILINNAGISHHRPAPGYEHRGMESGTEHQSDFGFFLQ